MIDTHLHILPGIDDGPETMQEALMLARTLVHEGVDCAVATPHYNDEFPRYSASEIRARVKELQQELDRYDIPLRVLAGHEALIKPGLVEDVLTGRIATLNGSRYLLLELWNSGWIPETERVIFELQICGIIPVIAHPERYRVFQKDPVRLASLLQRGVVTQLTAGSLLGMQGSTTRRTAELLLKSGLIHCIASDAHSMRLRAPGISEGLLRAENLLDGARVRQMTEVYPAVIVNNGTWHQ
ncbi:MAG TPA: CpsB/CapC family capsule biosynthesis tyrosine phosphatase [Ktedonobacteraceae bacterium]|nr:CpsB/CapC family capsule biosynthesis tyrosine phosphatase [Ktedonobacteraceae bacterium]